MSRASHSIPLSPGHWRSLAAVLLLMLFALSACSGGDARETPALRQRKVELVDGVRVSLLQAANAEKDALLAQTPAHGQQAREASDAAMAKARQDLETLERLVKAGAHAGELATLTPVATDFKELAPLEESLRALAGKNANRRAAALSRTEAALAVSRLQQVLTPVIEGTYCPAGQTALRMITATLSILALHAQHIEEATSAGKATLAAAMQRQNERARAALDALAGLLPPGAVFDAVPQAKAAYDDFWRVTGEILALSRQNTNVEATALVMKRMEPLTDKTLADLRRLRDVLRGGQDR